MVHDTSKNDSQVTGNHLFLGQVIGGLITLSQIWNGDLFLFLMTEWGRGYSGTPVLDQL